MDGWSQCDVKAEYTKSVKCVDFVPLINLVFINLMDILFLTFICIIKLCVLSNLYYSALHSFIKQYHRLLAKW